ncbi:MAG: hypothetical protein IIX01_00055 [Clostridia bacterium]|nr:hypothetical protein [Clostridia bacterium]
MKRAWTKIYTAVCILAMLSGFFACFYFSWGETKRLVWCVAGLFLGLAFTPFFHEIGHFLAGKSQKMQLKYLKFFIFRFMERDGKIRFSFSSPFSAEETQMIPKSHENMLERAKIYTLGGLIFGGVSILVLSAGAIVCLWLKTPVAFAFLTALPYGVYLFMLNIIPVYYAGGKTDMLVYCGLKKGKREECAMLKAMEIFGFLAEGKSFSEIDEEYYQNIPTVCEDEPIFAIVTDLKYRYYVEKGAFEKAANEINRLAGISEYLTDAQTEEVAAELTYMHLLNGDLALAEETKGFAENFLSQNTLQAKRITALYYAVKGEQEQALEEMLSAKKLLLKETLLGKRKAEEILLKRIPKP